MAAHRMGADWGAPVHLLAEVGEGARLRKSTGCSGLGYSRVPSARRVTTCEGGQSGGSRTPCLRRSASGGAPTSPWKAEDRILSYKKNHLSAFGDLPSSGRPRLSGGPDARRRAPPERPVAGPRASIMRPVGSERRENGGGKGSDAMAFGEEARKACFCPQKKRGGFFLRGEGVLGLRNPAYYL